MERKVGTISRGIRCPIIREGDDLIQIVTDSVIEAAKSDAENQITDAALFVNGKEITNIKQMTKINTLFEIFEGGFPVYAYYADENKYDKIANVNLSNPLITELKYIIGEENVVVRS